MSPRKTSRRGANSVGNDTLPETISKPSLADVPGEKQKRRRSSTRQVRKSSLLQSDVEQSTELNKSKRRTTQIVQETSREATGLRKKVSNRISRLKEAAALASASPLSGNLRSRNAKHRLEDFTPESSPITVILTPHRTTKTPRKSPMDLGSPKSHADAPLRLSKTPRKLHL